MKRSLVIILISLSLCAKAQLGAPALAPLMAKSNAIQSLHLKLQKINDSAELAILADQFEKFKENLDELKATKRELEKIYNLYEDFNRGRERIENIREFTLADGFYFAEMFTDVDMNPVNYVPNLGGKTNDFKRDMQGVVGRPRAARDLYKGFMGMTRSSETFLDDYVFLDENVQMDLEDAAMQAKVEEFSMLAGLIYKKHYEAQQMRELANDPNVKMEESERIKLNAEANRLMDEVISLRSKSMTMLVDIQSMEYGQKAKEFMQYSIGLKAKKEMSSVIYSTVFDAKRKDERSSTWDFLNN